MQLFTQQKLELIELERLQTEFDSHKTTSPIPLDLKYWLSPALFEALGSPNVVVSTFETIPLSSCVKLALAESVIEVAPGIFSLDLFSVDACEYLKSVNSEFSEFSLFKRAEVVSDIPLQSFFKRPAPLSHMDLEYVEKLLFKIVNIILPATFPELATFGSLDWCQGYIVGYSPILASGVQRSALVSHTDDSEVTVNISLSGDYSGGDLLFRGLRGSTDQDEVSLVIKPAPGIALIHSGRHLHEVKEVLAGERFNLILWSRSICGTRSQLCPCCWMNNRSIVGSKCVCGKFWN
jgi:hypothetical protein